MIRDGKIYEPLPMHGRDGHQPERRLSPRWPIARTCKLRRDGSVRFEPATTSDVSTTGAKLLVERSEAYAVGQRIEIAVAWDAKPTIPHGESFSGTVVRIEPDRAEGRAALAVAFDRPVSLDAIVPETRAA